MPQAQAALLELGERAVVRARRVVSSGVFQQRFRAQYCQHLFGVVLPVGGDMNVPAGFKFLNQLRHEWRLDQAALVVARLVPWVGEEDVHAVQRVVGQHVAQHFDCIVLDDADITELPFLDLLEQAAYAGRMHLDGEVIVVRVRLRDGGGGLAHAETDLENFWCTSAKDGIEVQHMGGIGNTMLWHQRVVAALLRIRDAPLAQHKAADVAGAFQVVMLLHQALPIIPLVGELGDAL